MCNLFYHISLQFLKNLQNSLEGYFFGAPSIFVFDDSALSGAYVGLDHSDYRPVRFRFIFIARRYYSSLFTNEW